MPDILEGIRTAVEQATEIVKLKEAATKADSPASKKREEIEKALEVSHGKHASDFAGRIVENVLSLLDKVDSDQRLEVIRFLDEMQSVLNRERRNDLNTRLAKSGVSVFTEDDKNLYFALRKKYEAASITAVEMLGVDKDEIPVFPQTEFRGRLPGSVNGSVSVKRMTYYADDKLVNSSNLENALFYSTAGWGGTGVGGRITKVDLQSREIDTDHPFKSEWVVDETTHVFEYRGDSPK